METDCDQRVLAAVPDRERYATLLVDVGSRQMGLFLTPALAEHGNGLERRITMIAKTMIQNRWKAAALTVAGIAVTVVACESRYPQEPQPAREAARVTDGMMMDAERVEVSELKEGATDTGERTRVEVAEMREGAFNSPDAAEFVFKHYPPMLRAAGVGGTVRVRATMHASGNVDGFEVVGTSGHKALDEAGLKVARDMKVYPSMKFADGQESQNVDFLFEFDPKMNVRTRAPLKVSEMAPGPKQVNVDKVTGPTLNNTKEMIRELIDNYPPVLRDAGIGGSVLLLVRVNPDGTLRDAKIKDSSGHAALDQAALKVARKMKFQPAAGQSSIPDGWFPAPVLFVSSN
jgi:TonB family protein